MDYTQNLHLPQFAATDRIHHDDFNAAFSKLDTAVSGAGNCRIAMGSYVGSGECGADHPNTLTFDFRPLVLWVNTTEKYNSAAHVVFLNPGTYFGFPNANSASFRVAWSDRGVSWYAGGMNSFLSANYQYNVSGQTYHYIAIGTAE